MSTIQCLKKSSCHTEKPSVRKLLNLVKAAKPVLELLKRKRRTNAVTPSTCNYAVESFQNDTNELFRLDFKFLDDCDEVEENQKNEELERRLLKVSPGWTPRADVDICKRGDGYATGGQRAERQVPVAAM